jgi:HAD superfamily hydrolase (TIGR01490 family)
MSCATKKAYAFFDVDGTIISIKSMLKFQEFYYLQWGSANSLSRQLQYQKFMMIMRYYYMSGRGRDYLNYRYYKFFKGRKPDDVEDCARAWFSRLDRHDSQLYNKVALDALRHHQDHGVEPVLVSGSLEQILTPLSEKLGIKHVLATRLEVVDGKFTGNIMPPQMIGAGKKTSIKNFLSQRNILSNRCFAYGDDFTDIPMLEAVGIPVIIPGDPALERYAAARSWQILKYTRMKDLIPA